ATNQAAASVERVGNSSRRGVDGINRLNNSMVVIARNAAGAHPAVGQLVDVVGTFAIGTGAMVGVLAGLTALALAVRKLTEEAQAAKEETEDVVRRLEEVARRRSLGQEGQLGADVTRGRAELQRIRQEIEDLERSLQSNVGADV